MSYFNSRKSSFKNLRIFFSFLVRLLVRILFTCREWKCLCRLYFRYPRLFLYDLFQFAYSLVRNPYRLLRRSPLSSLLKDGNIYGETPWSALDVICKHFGLTSKEIIYDLGCGLGKVCFWFSEVVHASVIGVDNQSEFISFARRAHRWFAKQPALFVKENFSHATFDRATCVYFYGSSYSLKVLKNVLARLQKLSAGSIVITISFPLDSLPQGEQYFYTETSCQVRFPWGKTIAYKNIRY